MTQRGVNDLTQSIGGLIDRTIVEYDMTLAEVVGVLHITATNLTNKVLEEEDGEDEEDGDAEMRSV